MTVPAGLLGLTLTVFNAATIGDLPPQVITCGWHYIDPVSQPPTLEALVARVRSRSPELDDALAQLRRWYTACDHTAARMAARTFRRISSRRGVPDRNALMALHGIALLRGPEVHVASAPGLILKAARFQSNAEREGVRLLQRVFESTGWPELATELAEAAFATRRRETTAAAAASLMRLVEETEDADYRALLAEILLLQQDFAAAKNQAQLADEGGSALAPRALGMALMLLGETSTGGDAYLRGLSNAHGAVLHRYFDDFRLLLNEDEQAAWEQLATSERGGWIRARWDWRAMLTGVSVQERLAEHHRRLMHAVRSYPRTSYRGAPGIGAIWTERSQVSVPLDDRGILYLRHGPPDQEFRMLRSSRIAWGYGGIMGGAIFEFDRVHYVPDYYLVGPLEPRCRGVILQERRGVRRSAQDDLLDWTAVLHVFDPRLAMFYHACNIIPADELPMLFAQARADMVYQAAVAWRTETGSPQYDTPLTSSLNLYAFRAADGAELVGYFSILAGRLKGVTTAASTDYGVRFVFSAGDIADGGVQRLDTIIALSTASLPSTDARISIALPIHVSQWREAKITATITNVHDTREGRTMAGVREIPAFMPGRLSVSDVVIAENRDGTWRRGSELLAPLPGHVLSANGEFRVYYEVYGVTADDLLELALTVAPSADRSVLGVLRSLVSRRRAMTLSFLDHAHHRSEGTSAWMRTIHADLEPGAYALSVSIRNPRTGEQAQARTSLIVRR